MTDLEKLKSWLETYPGMDRLQSVQIDYLPQIFENGSICPSGLTELSRTEDLLGNVVVNNQYCFGLYYVLAADEDENDLAASNAQWVLDLQKWVQQQSVQKLVPTFGDRAGSERATAHDGVLYAKNEDGSATYLVRLTCNFTKIYEVI